MFNQFTGIGNLTADPESKFTPKGTQVANFTVCCDSGYGDNKKTEFVRCVAWDKLAKICVDYFHKGQRVIIQGAMQTRKWQDSNGVDRYSTEIILQTAKNLSPREDNATKQQSPNFPPPQSGGFGGGGYTGEDVPF